MARFHVDNLMPSRRPASSCAHVNACSQSESGGVTAAGKPVRRKAVRRIVLLSIVAAVVYGAHPAFLRGIAWGLIADEPPSRTDYVWIRAALDDVFDQAARLYHKDRSRRVLVIRAYPSRLVEMGALPHFEAITRLELDSRGVPDDAVTAVDGKPGTAWEEAHLLGAWMDEHPSAQVLLVCDRFESRRSRLVLDTVLRPGAAARVRILGLRRRQYDETNWWKSRLGLRALFCGYVSLLYAWCQGENVPERPVWDPDAYERLLCEATKGGP